MSQHFQISLQETMQKAFTNFNHQCHIKYLDCRGYYDLVSHLISIIVGFLILYRSVKHLRHLHSQKTEDKTRQYQRSLRRKISVHIMQIIFLVFFILTLFLSIGIFEPSISSKQQVQEHKLNKIYKLSQIIFINLLNSLNLTVGFLYWKAIRAYYILAQENVPCMFYKHFKVFYFVFFCFNGSAIIITIVWTISDIILKDSINLVTLITTIISIVMCITCRYIYRTRILSKIEISERPIRKQVICSILIFISSFIRISFYLAEYLGFDYTEKVRNFNDPNRCLDTWPFNAIIMLFIDLIVNLLPTYIYSYLFTAQFQVSTYRKNDRPLLD